MHATIYGRGQMVIPAKIRKQARISQGDVLDVRAEGDGRVTLMRMEKPRTKPSLKVHFIKRKGRHTVGSTGKPITSEQVRSLMNELT